MFRGYTFRLKPLPDQEEKFLQFAGVCRLVWNLALEQRSSHWRNYQARTGNNLNFYTQSAQLKQLRAEFDWVREVSQTSQQCVLANLDDAFKRFFKGVGGYPSFKKKGTRDSFSFKGREVSVERLNRKWGKVRLPKIGWVKFRWTRDIVGKITEATVFRNALGWQISFGCKDVQVPGFATDGAIGVDRGVAVPVALSDGSSYSLPCHMADIDKKAGKAQRIASRRKRGSKRHAIAQKRVAKLRAKQARIRKHWAHETTTDICRKFGTVVIERLRTKDMTKSVPHKRGLNRAILNVGWHQIEAMLFYKAARVIKVNPAYTSQTCSACGTVDKKSRDSQSRFLCTNCGFHANADHNAAINILNRGITPGVEAAIKRPSKREPLTA